MANETTKGNEKMNRKELICRESELRNDYKKEINRSVARRGCGGLEVPPLEALKRFLFGFFRSAVRGG